MVTFSVLSGIPCGIPLKAVASSHNPGHIFNVPIGSDGRKLHGIVGDRGLRRGIRFSFGFTMAFSRSALGLFGFVVVEEDVPILQLEQERVLLSSLSEYLAGRRRNLT